MTPIITHNILWIDDDVLVTINSFLRTNGINSIIRTCYKDGIEYLENKENRANIDAVILDVNCKVSKEEKDPTATAFRDSINKVIPLCTPQAGKFIPWFVLTAGSGFHGAESLEMIVPIEDWTLKQFYYKGDYEDLKSLVQHIKQLTADVDIVKLRSHYSGIWGVCHEAAEVDLLSIIRKFQQDEQTSDTNIFLEMRNILAATVTRGKQCGLFPDFIMKANDAKNILRILSTSDDSIVPLYISFNYSALCDTVNNGCHMEDEDPKKLKVHPDVSTGNAPYLIRTAFYQLLTILKWLGLHSTGEKSTAVLKKQVENILGIPTKGEQIHLYRDRESGIICYKKCVAWCKDISLSTADLENEFFIVEEIIENTKSNKDKFPYFIKVKAS